MQCPPDFVGIPAVVSLGAALGRKIAIRPQRSTDWTEVPNFWGCIIGRPGALKSPAMRQVIKPLQRLEAQAEKQAESAMQKYAADLELVKFRKDEAKKKAKDALKKGLSTEGLFNIEEPEQPTSRRYITNDTSYESLGEILAANPYGVLAFRDELVSLLKTLDREEYAATRGFFLTAWNGTDGYTFDRIIRCKTRIEAACLSLLGSTQPGRIAEYMRRAIAGGAADDGLIQRFSLISWPDQSPEWRDVDRWPDSEARRAAWDAFGSFDSLDPMRVGAQVDDFDGLPFLRFDDAAQEVFAGWRNDLEHRLRAGELHPALESHLSKYRKLVPSLALVNHLADHGEGPIAEAAILRALAFAQYLESHARRAYGAGTEAESAAAMAILFRIRNGDLKDGFTARELWRNQWTGLTDLDAVKAGIELLVDLAWLDQTEAKTGGRPLVKYDINPRGEP
ncbi:YfjI family protein [Methylocystis sp. IM3]